MADALRGLAADLLPALIPGLIYGIGAVGVFLITYYIRITDLTILGSFLLSGVVGVWSANALGDFAGLFVGLLSGGLCGLVTALLITWGTVQPVLAGIISYSLATAGAYAIVSSQGSVSRTHGTFLASSFSNADLILILALEALIILTVHFLLQSKWGGLISALLAKPVFKRNRHRFRTSTVVGVFVLGHALIGLSGFLSALKSRVVAVEMSTSTDFLIKAFGAYYGGYVFAAWGKAVTKFLFSKLHADAPIPDLGDPLDASIPVLLRRSLVSESIDSRIGILLSAQVLGCIVLSAIALLATRSSSALNYSIQALLLFAFVKLAKADGGTSPL